jgi:CDP-6-deoxy-D-xylo-4-hexulose-3-dehydrase
MGRTQLKKLPEIKELREVNYQQLYEGLMNMNDIKLLETPDEANPSWFGFPMFVKNRGALREFLESRQIETRTIFGGNITNQPAFRGFGRIATGLRISDKVMYEGMFVSVHPDTTPEMIDFIISSIKEFYEAGGGLTY